MNVNLTDSRWYDRGFVGMAVIAVVLFGVAANFGRSEDGADGLGAFSALVVLKVEATVVCDFVKDPQELLGVGNIEPGN